MVEASPNRMTEETFEEIKAEVLRLFCEDEPLLAWNTLQNLEQTIKEEEPAPNPLLVNLLGEFKESEQMELLAKDVVILGDFRDQMRLFAENKLDQSWIRHKDTPEVKIYYKHEDGFRNVTLYMEKVVNAPMINLLAVFAEAQLFQNWVPLNRRSEILCSVSHFRKAAEFEFKLPWPLSNRTFLLQACGIALPEDNGSILTLSSIHQDSWLGQEMRRTPNNVYADLHRGSLMVKSLGPDRQVLKMIANADPKINFVPQRLINFAMRHVCEIFLNLVEDKSKNLSEEYLQLIQEKQDFYDAVRTKCASTLNNSNPAL